MDDDNQRFDLPMQVAVKRWQQEPGTPSNSYDWYRKSAQRYGHVWMGVRRQLMPSSSRDVHVDARKVGNRWMVDAGAFEAALDEHRLAKAETEIITQAYKEHRLLVGPGGSRDTSWGGYSVREHFHLTWYNGSRENGGGEGSWFCNTCFAMAKMERNKDECHTCSDWGSCGRDCRLSGISCATCGTSMTI